METRRRLITSSSFAVGWFHLDGPVHLEKEKETEGGKGNPRLAWDDGNNCYSMLKKKSKI